MTPPSTLGARTDPSATTTSPSSTSRLTSICGCPVNPSSTMCFANCARILADLPVGPSSSRRGPVIAPVRRWRQEHDLRREWEPPLGLERHTRKAGRSRQTDGFRS